MRRVKGEGSIYKDEKRNRWIAQYDAGFNKDGNRIRKSVTAKTKTELLKKLNEVMYLRNNTDFTKKNDITLIELIDIIREEKYNLNIIGDVQYTRLKETANVIRKSEIANMTIQSLNSYDIQNFLNSVTHYSDSYIRKIHEQIKGACAKAIKKEYITKNPMDDVIKPRSVKTTKEVRALTIQEQSKLVNYLKSVRIDEEPYKVCFLLEMFSGLRIGETLALKKDDIDFKNGVIKITRTLTLDLQGKVKMNNRAKTYSGRRRLLIPDEIKNELKEQVELSEGHKDNLLFVAGNEYVRHNSVNSVLKRIFRTQLGLEDKGISTHVLRHTFATRCIELGMNAVVLQKLMGHKDIGVTLNTYTSVFNEFKENEIKKVGKILSKKLAETSEEYEL